MWSNLEVIPDAWTSVEGSDMGQIIEREIWFMACMCSYSYAHDEYDTGEFNASFQLE